MWEKKNLVNGYVKIDLSYPRILKNNNMLILLKRKEGEIGSFTKFSKVSSWPNLRVHRMGDCTGAEFLEFMKKYKSDIIFQ